MATHTENAVQVELRNGKQRKGQPLKKLPVLHRAVDFTRAEDGKLTTDEQGRYQVCLSSEAPVDRWFGAEILDHSKDSIDLSRFERGIPLLVNHDTDDQVGLIEDPEIGADRKLRGWARFGRSARAAEIKQDVDDGIRGDMSVGYRIKKMVMEESDDEMGETYRATLWQPMEGSIVPVPADIEAGVGRSGEDGAAVVELETVRTAAPDTGSAKERVMAEGNGSTAAPAGGGGNGGGSATIVRDYVAEAKEVAQLAKDFKMVDKLPEWAGRSPAEVRDLILRELQAKAEASAISTALPREGLVDLTSRERQRYSICRAVIAAADRDWSRAGLEKEVSDEIRKKLKSSMGYEGRQNSFFIPTVGLSVDAVSPEARERAMAMGAGPGLSLQQRATLAAGTSSLGGAAVFTEPMGFIELLRNIMTIRQAGARFLSGLTQPAAFPRQKTAATASWTSEAPGSAVAASNQTFEQLVLNPTALQSVVAYSRQLMIQATPDIDAIVREDIALIHALAIDLAGIAGSGSGQPTGILNQSGIGSVAVGTNGGAVTYTHCVSLEKTVEAANALRGMLAYLSTPAVKQDLRLTQKLSNTIGQPVWEGGQPGRINDYTAFSTNQVPSTLTKGTSTTICHALVYGNFQELLVGEFGAMEVLTDPYTLADKNSIRLVSFQLADVGVRHAASFAAVQDILP